MKSADILDDNKMRRIAISTPLAEVPKVDCGIVPPMHIAYYPPNYSQTPQIYNANYSINPYINCDKNQTLIGCNGLVKRSPLPLINVGYLSVGSRSKFNESRFQSKYQFLTNTCNDKANCCFQ